MRVSNCYSLRFGGQNYGRTISNFFLFDDPKYYVMCYAILMIAVYLNQTDQQRYISIFYANDFFITPLHAQKCHAILSMVTCELQ